MAGEKVTPRGETCEREIMRNAPCAGTEYSNFFSFRSGKTPNFS